MFNRCRRPHCWSPQAQSRCPSGVENPHCLIQAQMLCLILPRKLGRVSRAGIHLLNPTGSSCSRCLTAQSRTAAAPFSSSLDGHCQSCHHRIPQTVEGCPPHCWSGSWRHRTRCQTQCASCAPPRLRILTRCLFVCMGKSTLSNFLMILSLFFFHKER